jgi:four helix bundle protein
MSKIGKLEEIKAWQEARELVKEIYSVTSKGRFARDFGLRDQIRRASVSVMSNVAEGYARSSDKEFAQFLSIALGSTAEVQSQLYIARDLGYITNDEFNGLYSLCGKTAKLITGFINYLKNAPS